MAPVFLVALVIAAVLVPLPQMLVDLLLSASLAGSVLIFVAALRTREAASFHSFPRLLLLVTSFRLVLNAATTRLILAEGDAGRVIDAFAGVVTRGDLVVGMVMFGIITAIQYLVIARGSERVAEVGARFALDGMPGRQAAIEADLRAGVISPTEAGRRRAQLDARSEFHGAMDGAVKFVKADAIVGLIVVAVNVLGGLAIGMLRLGLPLGEALDVYGRLAIGDGLLSQIPAVMLSLSAGLLVARVEARGPKPAPWFEPAMLLVPAAMLLGVALVPGMPGLAFGIVGASLLVVAVAFTARQAPPTAAMRRELVLHLPARFARGEARLQSAMTSLAAQAGQNLGLPLPAMELAFAGQGAPLELRRGDRLLLREPLDPAADAESVMVPVFRALIDHGEQFVDLQVIDAWLERERRERPAVAKAVTERMNSAQVLALVRALLRGGVPLPEPREILAAIAELPAFGEVDEQARWPEHLRIALAQTWVRDFVDARAPKDGSVTWLRATPDLELALEQHAQSAGGRWSSKLPAARRREIRDAVLERGGGPRHTLLVTRMPARAACAAVFADLHPNLPVLSTTECERAGLDLQGAAWVDEDVVG